MNDLPFLMLMVSHIVLCASLHSAPRQRPLTRSKHIVASITEQGSTELVSEDTYDVITQHGSVDRGKSEQSPADCTPDQPMCLLTDDDGCPEGCSTHADFGAESGANIFGGGAECNDGKNICTCKLSGSALITKTVVANVTACASICQGDSECLYAFFAQRNGECSLLRSCSSRISAWVGKQQNQGGATFQKYQRPLRVDPGENVWPVEYFGDYNQVPWSSVSPQPWHRENSTKVGWDWSLPAATVPSSRGILALERTFNMQNTNKLKTLPSLGFRVNAIVDMWVDWALLEPDEGKFDFEAYLENIRLAVERGWKVGVRIITCPTKRAPDYLGPTSSNGTRGYNLTTRDTGRQINYDPADPTFHSHYLALVKEVGRIRLCQNDDVVSMYVGYASKAFGDEGIGPHDDDNPNAADPDVYPHVIERLNAWKQACAGVEHKVMMGGFSNFGLSNGFGFRGGFIEKYYYKIPDAHLGQVWSSTHPYLSVDESVPALAKGVLLGEVNEEYGTNEVYRHGNVSQFPYRYFMSSLRALQMRTSWLGLLTPFTLNSDLAAFLALEVGRVAADSPDAWSFLMQVEMRGGPLKNFERWLHQRDNPQLGIETVPDARMTQTPVTPTVIGQWMTADKHDFIARAAPKGVISFFMANDFILGGGIPDVVKVTFFDVVGAGSIQVVVPVEGMQDGMILGSQPTTGDSKLKTATFVVGAALLRSPSFEVRGLDTFGASQEIIVSFVRIMKTIKVLRDDTGCASGCSTHGSFNATGAIVFNGGPTCAGGKSICTCSQQETIETLVLPSKDATLCAEKCLERQDCQYAFFSRGPGKCWLLPSCNKRKTHWVGQDRGTQGGVTFQKE